MQFCDGTYWYSMKNGGVGGLPTGCQADDTLVFTGSAWACSSSGSDGGGGGGALSVADVFSTDLYTGNGATTQAIVNGIDFSTEGGLIWLKKRNGSTNHVLLDTARGAYNALFSSTIGAQSFSGGPQFAFNTNGFSVLNSGWSHNDTSDTYVGWSFRKAPKFFDVVTYTGDGSASRDIAHSLGLAPGMIITKRLNLAGDWATYHTALGYTKRLYVNLTNAASINSATWMKEPSSTHFTVGSENTVGDQYVAYLFAHDDSADGIIQCGGYTGNGSSSGPTVNLGWEPQYLILKRASGGTGDWTMYDSARSGSNPRKATFDANASSAEDINNHSVDFISTGFQIKTNNTELNNVGDTYVHCAIRAP